MNITFIGTGYVGLVSGVMMSHLGHHVTCLDVDVTKINQLKKLHSPIFEEGLEEYITKYGNSARLNFKYGYDESLSSAEVIFITVGTPQGPRGEANLTYIFEAILNGAKYANPEAIFVIKSTVPPGTCHKIKDLLHQNGFNFHIVSNPEFLREGTAVYDFLNPDRIIIGAESAEDFAVMRAIYKPITDKGVALIESDLITAELIKYAANSFLATKIAFINEMADLCEIIGADVNKLSSGIGLDKRIGEAFLKAGPGFGGSCFPKDILALQNLTNEVNVDSFILDAVIKANTTRPNLMMNKIKKLLGKELKDKKIAVLGLTYKAGTDDLRNSPAVDLINLLLDQGSKVIAYDPQGMKKAEQYFGDRLSLAPSALEATKDADAIIIATEWPQFADLDYKKIKNQLAKAVIIDLRNILDRKMLVDLGYKCYFVGGCHSGS